ncbi:hypothetical protein ABK040_009369 [Willaertia magna]
MENQFEMSEEASINYLIEITNVSREEAIDALECCDGNVDSALDQLLLLKEEVLDQIHNTDNNFNDDNNMEDNTVINDDYSNNERDLVTTNNGYNNNNYYNNSNSIYFGKQLENFKKDSLQCFRDLMMCHFDLNQTIKTVLKNNLCKLIKIYLKFEKDKNIIPLQKNTQYFYKFIIERMLMFQNELLQKLIKRNTRNISQNYFCDISIQFKEDYNYCENELKYWKSQGKEIETKDVTDNNELVLYMSLDGLKNIPQLYELFTFPATELQYTLPVNDNFEEYIPAFLICNIFNELQINCKKEIIIEKPLKSELCQYIPEELNHLVYNISQSTIFTMINIANSLYYSDRRMLDVLCAFIAMLIKGKSPEQIRELFEIKNDFTPEEEERIREENKWVDEA